MTTEVLSVLGGLAIALVELLADRRERSLRERVAVLEARVDALEKR